MDGAQLVQRDHLIPAVFLLPGEVECPARVLPGLFDAARQTTDLAEPCDPIGSLRPARMDSDADRLLQQRTPLREAPLECRGKTQARQDWSQPVQDAGGTTEGQALLQHLDGRLQV